MANLVPDYKQRALEKRLAGLQEEYEVASAQLSRTLSDVDRLRIQRQITDLEREIEEIEKKLGPDAERLDWPEPDPENEKHLIETGFEPRLVQQPEAGAPPATAVQPQREPALRAGRLCRALSLSPPACWGALGLVVTALAAAVFFRGVRCVLEYRVTEAMVALVVALVAGVGTAFNRLVPLDTRRVLLGLYSGIGVALVGCIVVAVVMSPPAEAGCFGAATAAPAPTATDRPTATSTTAPGGLTIYSIGDGLNTYLVSGESLAGYAVGDGLVVYGFRLNREVPIGLLRVVGINPDTLSAQAELVHEDYEIEPRLRVDGEIDKLKASELVPAYEGAAGYLLEKGRVRLRPEVEVQVGTTLQALERQLIGGVIRDYLPAGRLQVERVGTEGAIVEVTLLEGEWPPAGTPVQVQERP